MKSLLAHLQAHRVPFILLAAAAAGCLLLLASSLASRTEHDRDVAEDPDHTQAASLRGAPRNLAAAMGAEASHGRVVGVVSRLGQPVHAHVDLLRAGDRDLAQAMAGGVTAGPLDGVARTTYLLAPPLVRDALAETAATGGRFEFTGVLPGFYVLRAWTSDGATGCVEVDVIPSTTAVVEIAMPGGLHVVRGRAVHADGRPFSGVVALRPSRPDYGAHDLTGEVAARTASDGSFVLSGLLPGQYDLSAMVPGRFRVTSFPVTVPCDEPYLLTVDAGLLERRGRVLAAEDAAPIPNAHVVLRGGEPDWRAELRASTRTDASGGFRLWCSTSWLTLRVEADGFAPTKQAFETGYDGELTVRMHRSGHLKGRVVEAGTGRPVRGIQVCASTYDGPKHLATTDASGAYDLDVAPGRTTVVVVSEAWVMSGAESGLGRANAWLHRVRPGDVTTADLVVEPAAHVGGIVLDADGKAAAGARVYVDGSGADGAPAPAHLSPWLTDADGRFQAGGLLPGVHYTLEFRHPGAPYFRQSFQAGRDTDVVVRLPASRRLTVRVTDAATRQPVPGATVAFFRGKPTEAHPLQQAGTDANGVAVATRLPPGPLTLSAQAAGYVAYPFTLVPDSPTDSQVLEHGVALERGLAIKGKVRLPEGAEWEALELQGWSEDLQAYVPPTVGPDGSFGLDGLAAGSSIAIEASIDVGEESYWGVLNARAGDHDILLTLEPRRGSDERALHVTVHGVDGEKGGWGMVHLVAGTPPRPQRQQRYMNGYALLRLPDDLRETVWLVVQPWERDLESSSPGPVVAGPFSPQAGAVDIRLTPGSAIEGRLTNEQGKPMAGWTIEATSDSLPAAATTAGMTAADGARLLRSSTLTLADGTFRISCLIPRHRYRVVVLGIRSELPAGVVREGPVSVVAPSWNLVLVARTAQPRTVVVEAPDGAPVAGAWVTWNMGRGIGMQEAAERMKTDAAGRATAQHLDPNVRYVVRVHSPNARWRGVDVEETGEEEMTVRLGDR